MKEWTKIELKRKRDGKEEEDEEIAINSHPQSFSGAFCAQFVPGTVPRIIWTNPKKISSPSGDSWFSFFLCFSRVLRWRRGVLKPTFLWAGNGKWKVKSKWERKKTKKNPEKIRNKKIRRKKAFLDKNHWKIAGGQAGGYLRQCPISNLFWVMTPWEFAFNFSRKRRRRNLFPAFVLLLLYSSELEPFSRLRNDYRLSKIVFIYFCLPYNPLIQSSLFILKYFSFESFSSLSLSLSLSLKSKTACQHSQECKFHFSK